LLLFWRKGDIEVDLVIETPKGLWAIEVKSGRVKNTKGLAMFKKEYPRASARVLLIGHGGISLNRFFSDNPLKILV